MIVKMIILRLLGSSDDKEKGSGAPEEPTPRASVHPTLVGRTDSIVFWCRRESKPSQLIATG